MYNEPGKKLKIVAHIGFAISFIVSFVFCCILMTNNTDGFLYGLAILLGGPVLGWFLFLPWYGFGHLLEIVEQYDHSHRQ